MKPGCIVEFGLDGSFHLGGVIETVGEHKFVVVCADGVQRRVARDDVTRVFETTVDGGDVVEFLAQLDAAADALVASLDLPTIWSLVRDADKALDIDELCALTFAHSDDARLLAIVRALRADDIYFRVRRNLVEARSPEQVDELLYARQLTRSRDASRQDFVTRVTAILELPRYQRAAAFKEANEDPAFRPFADLLRDFAAADGEFARRAEADELLDAIEAASSETLTGTVSGRGFNFMLAVGVWSEHEVVAVHRHRLELSFPAEIEEAATAIAASGFDRAGRADFTRWWTCTIDDVETRDIDDALSVRATEDGGWELAIHIADPSAFVRHGDPVDLCAARRGTSVYLATGTAAMFPPVLSEQAMSLVRGLERPALTLHVRLDEELDILGTELCESVVKVDRRYSYDEVDRMLDDHRDRSHAAETLASLRYIADELFLRRVDRGAVTIELPEPRVKVDLDDYEPEIRVDVEVRTPARSIVAEMMVLMGEQVARWCSERNIPILYRCQERPDIERGDASVQRIPEGPARDFALLCSMKKGEVRVAPARHAGLGIAAYTQTTSPIRRYGDVAVHRQIKAALRAEPLPYDEEAMMAVAASVEKAAFEASTAERESLEYWLLRHLATREGDELDAIVLDERGEVLLTEFGFRTRARLRKATPPGTPVRLTVERVRPRAGVFLLRD